mgnify:CR=1 FL=1|tara:strand:- start:747 stop:998 length:252 start_codon:yes stop_codon:yes gene_type:complete
MNSSKLIESKKENNSRIITETLYKGACVKIKKSKKTFQVIGINLEKKICWIREWPFPSVPNKAFPLEISQITLQLFCSEQFSE